MALKGAKKGFVVQSSHFDVNQSDGRTGSSTFPPQYIIVGLWPAGTQRRLTGFHEFQLLLLLLLIAITRDKIGRYSPPD